MNEEVIKSDVAEEDIRIKNLPKYTVIEERINVITHLIGSIISVIGFILMLTLASINKNVTQIIGVIVFGLSLIWLYSMSTLYHNEKNLQKRRIRQKMDHLSINILIAGSNTVFLVSGINSKIGYIFAGGIWALSLISMILNSINVKKFRAVTMVIYILTGWACAVLYKQIIASMGLGGFISLLIGGLFYTFGLIFYSIKKQYMHSIWHIFVLSGSISHIVCVTVWILL